MIEWEPGRDSDGLVPMGGGKPIYARSKCGRYTICRAETARGWVSDAWYIAPDGTRTQLDGGISAKAALKVVEDHANGLLAETAG